MSLDLSGPRGRQAGGSSTVSQHMQHRRLLRQDVYEILLREFIAGDFAPGERVRDDDIAQRLNVSRTPVREALSRLSYAGLVDTAPNRYTMATVLDYRDVVNAVDVLETLYPPIIRHVVEGITADDDVELEILERRIGSAHQLDLYAAIEAIAAFCSERLHAELLAQLIGMVQPRLARAIRLEPELLAGSLDAETLVGMVHALRARDAVRASRILTDVLSSIRRLVSAAGDRRSALG